MLKTGVSNSNQDDFGATHEPVVGTPRWRTSSAKKSSRVLDTTMQVTTPENISFHYQLAGPFRRILAYFLDIVISIGAYAIVCFAIYMVLAMISALLFRIGATGVVEAISGIVGGLLGVGWFVLYWFYGAYMEAQFNGQTLGKRITKMRVITTDGHAIDGVQAALRNFFRFLDIMPMGSLAALFLVVPSDWPYPMDEVLAQIAYVPLLPTCLFGLIVMTFNRKYQRVGDLVANTVVVNEELNRLPQLEKFTDNRVPLLAELIPTSFVVPASMGKTIAEYVDRRNLLPYQRASEIASHLAAPLLEKFRLPADTDYDLFLCALYHKTFISTEIDPDQAAPLPAQSNLPSQSNQPGPIGIRAQSISPNPIQSGSEKLKSEFQLDPEDFRINP